LRPPLSGVLLSMTPPLRPMSFTSCFLDVNGAQAVCTEPVNVASQNARVTLMHAGRSSAYEMEL
jgi:hypothetical protein